jgi:Fe-S oxidoreductase
MSIEPTMNLFVKKTGGWVASQLEACTRCGMCAEACPYYLATGKAEYAPIWKVEPLRRAYEQRFTLIGKLKVALGVEKALTDADLKAWSKVDFEACSVCGKCSGACPMGIEISSLIATVRAGITAAGLAPAGLVEKTEMQMKCGSPNGMCEDEYIKWFDSLEEKTGVKAPLDVKGADMLVVYTSLEIKDKRHNLYDLAKILNAAGIKWTISMDARDAFNMGSIIGNPKVQKELAGKILNTAKKLGVKQILVTECGHGFTTLRDAVPNVFGEELPFFVTHIAELLPNLIKEGKIKVKEGYFKNGHTYTFHDSCKIQRQGGIMDEPRYALKLLAGDTFKEMDSIRENGLCCGGGGGIRSIPEANENRLAAFKLKLAEVEKVGADVVVSTCDNCQLQLKDGFKHYNKAVEVKGLIEMVAEAMI